jgi:hypothetical protein
LIEDVAPHAESRVLAKVAVGEHRLPVWSLVFGSRDARAPVLSLVGGVHGLERIGTQVVLAYLHTLRARLSWDRVLHDLLERVRLVIVPLVNPGGMWLGTRGNPRGVDLMRNAHVHPDARGTFLVGGQRLSRRLPWYAGHPERGMEVESRALVELIEREVLGAPVAVALDCHSGFGMRDRLWFPYARTRKPFPRLGEVVALERLLDTTLPNHIYRMEPQAQTYTIEGDLWDHLYDLSESRAPGSVFVPLTLEMGSWLWVRKNPRQLGSVWGSFNPLVPHRLRRTLRRHLPLFDLLLHAVRSHDAWVIDDDAVRAALEHEAYARWPFA